MSQKKDDLFELNFDDFNTGLLEKNLEEKGTNEFLNYYIKLNSDLEQKKKDLETCKSCKFSSYGRLFYCCLHWYDKFYNWNCGILGKKALSGFYGPYV